MRLKTAIKTICMTMLCSMALLVASCSDNKSESDAPGYGTVTGIVTDELQTPIEGVGVIVEKSEISATTDASGAFTLKDVPMESRIVTFAKDGYQTTSVTVTAGKYDATSHATLAVEMVFANARITGFVGDAGNNGAAMEGVTVSLGTSQSMVTGADGRFEFANLVLGSYTLTFSKSGFTSITKQLTLNDFVAGVAEVDIRMGGEEVLRGLTKYDLMEADKWYYNEYRGGRNAEEYPHWDWACDYLCTLDFRGEWEEQNEGTTLRIRNTSDDQKNNPVDQEMFDSFVFGSKLITADNCYMTLESRTHSTSDTDPAYFGVQVIDLSADNLKPQLIGGMKTLNSEDYRQFVFDLRDYIGKEVIVAIGTFRMQTGDYWKQFVIRRIAFTKQELPYLWAWLPGEINEELEGWHLTNEMIRSTMPHTKSSFTGISPISGDRDNYCDAYRSWRTVAHIGHEWSFVPVNKDPEVFPSEGFIIKTRGGSNVSTRVPEAYFYTKFAISAGSNYLTLRARNFSSSNATFFKLTAITEDGIVTHMAPAKVKANTWENAADGCIKFMHEDGGAGNPDDYARFEFDLSAFNGQNVLVTLGVFKGEENGDENKLSIHSIVLE